MLVLGNGESRLGINLNRINDIKVGCNAIYRDYCIDHLVCVDRRMMNEIILNCVYKKSKIYTRQDWYKDYQNYSNVKTVPLLPYKGNKRWDEPFQWGSGPYAVLIAANFSKGKVNLLGFDLHSKSKNVNNVYKDTRNYDPASKRAVDPRYWIHQIGSIFKNFPKINFVIYQEEDWIMPEQWKYFNVSVDKISNIYYN